MAWCECDGQHCRAGWRRRYNERMSDLRPPQSPLTWSQLLGTGAGKLFRRAKGTPERNQRWFHGLRAGTGAFWQTVSHTLHLLFLEVSGVVFLTFTVVVAGAFLREWHKYTMHQSGVERVVVAGALSAMFFYFGLSSFWRASRKRSGSS